MASDSNEAQPAIAFNQQRGCALEPAAVNGCVADALEKLFLNLGSKDGLVRGAQCRKHPGLRHLTPHNEILNILSSQTIAPRPPKAVIKHGNYLVNVIHWIRISEIASSTGNIRTPS